MGHAKGLEQCVKAARASAEDDKQAESAEKTADSGDEEKERAEPFVMRATGRRTKMNRVANDDFHLQLPSRSPSPEPVKKRRKRVLNAEELAVADGLLGLQEASDLSRVRVRTFVPGEWVAPAAST